MSYENTQPTVHKPSPARSAAPSRRHEQVLALVPAYNEAHHIAGVVAGISAHLPVLVVDDGSTDETAALAEAAGAEVWRQTPNQGKGVALREGFRRALDAGYDAVLTLDADGQHDPEEAPLFIRAFTEKGADLVIGRRDFSQMPLPRRVANSVARWSISRVWGQSIFDVQSGYRLISRPLMEMMLESHEPGYEFEMEMIALCLRAGLKMEWLPIQTIYRDERSHIKPIQHTIHFFRVLWQLRR